MNSDIYFFITISLCICLAMFFVIKWFITYSENINLNLSKIISEGMAGLKYIGKNNPDFNGDEARKLNRLRRFAYLFMIIGITIIILSGIVD